MELSSEANAIRSLHHHRLRHRIVGSCFAKLPEYTHNEFGRRTVFLLLCKTGLQGCTWCVGPLTWSLRTAHMNTLNDTSYTQQNTNPHTDAIMSTCVCVYWCISMSSIKRKRTALVVPSVSLRVRRWVATITLAHTHTHAVTHVQWI